MTRTYSRLLEGFISAIALAAIFPIALDAQSSLPAQEGRPVPERTAASITPLRSKTHVDILADDRMMGRNTPSAGLDSAADYIAAQFKGYGLEPVAGTWFHRYNLKQEDLGKRNSLHVEGKSFELKNGFVPYEFSSSGIASGEVVFVGYGLSRPAAGYDDYAGIDVAGKIVVAFTGEPAPKGEEGSSVMLADAGPREKMRLAARHKAAGFLLMPNPRHSKFVKPTGYPWRSLFPSASKLPLPMKPDLPQEPGIPSMSISGDAGRVIFGRSLDAIADLARQIDSTGKPASALLKTTVEMETEIVKMLTSVRNVVGMVRGNVHPDEYVIVGAHYDHVGHRKVTADEAKAGSSTKPDSIFNGADDNASGTSGLLLAAEAFGALSQEERPARSVIFIAFSGEEKGLFGSRAYVANPLVPNQQVVAMLNMDMIGRNHRDSVSIAGRTRSKDLTNIAEAANRVEPMKIAYNLEEMFYRSDQASFAAKRIPVLFFSSGLHPDYHQVTDSPEKVNNEKVAHIARLCFRTTWLTANAPTRPVFAPEDEEEVAPSFFD